MPEGVPSEKTTNLLMWLMLPQFAVPFYCLAIYLTPPEYRYYWLGVWFFGTIFLWVFDPTVSGIDEGPAKSDLQFAMKIIRGSLMGMLPVSAAVFFIAKRLLS